MTTQDREPGPRDERGEPVQRTWHVDVTAAVHDTAWLNVDYDGPAPEALWTIRDRLHDMLRLQDDVGVSAAGPARLRLSFTMAAPSLLMATAAGTDAVSRAFDMARLFPGELVAMTVIEVGELVPELW
ncbi:hypothetical protein [Actinomadura sp. NTSP31]|uniref:hypothetical protein n=1 Tax=Actinomadura sp. NTSP31 TaxID=1735447 RepID=UPI0035C0DA64